MIKKILLLLFFTASNIAYLQNGNVSKFYEDFITLNYSDISSNINLNGKGEYFPYHTFIMQLRHNAGQNPNKDARILDILKKNKALEENLSLYDLAIGTYHFYNSTYNEPTFKNLTSALTLSKQEKQDNLIKICLLSLLEFYAQDIVQSNEDYKTYLQEFKSKANTDIEKLWFHIYNTKFASKKTSTKQSEQKEILKQFYTSFLNLQEHYLKGSYNDNLSIYYYYFKGSYHKNKGDYHNSSFAYLKVIDLAENKPFLKYLKFTSYIHLCQINANNGDYQKAKSNLANAKKEWNKSDTLFSKFVQKRFTAIYYFEKLKQFESAYFNIKSSIRDEQNLQKVKNTIKISELKVKLNIADKENEIVQLQNTNLKTEASRVKNRNLLIGSITFIIIGSILVFLVYKNTKRKQRIIQQEHEIKTQKTEKLLKEQELNAIDAIIAGQEKERQRLANDLHDNLGSTLATIKLHFQHIQSNRLTEKTKGMEELYSKTNELLDEAYRKVRTIAHEKNNGVMANQGLLSAITKLAKSVSNRDGLQMEVRDYGLEERLDNTLEISIFRIIQELVTNTIKHANASEIHISLTNHDSLLNIIIEDNGKGFNAKVLPQKEGIGLATIEKRIEHLEGTFEIDSTIGKGTNIIINIPI